MRKIKKILRFFLTRANIQMQFVDEINTVNRNKIFFPNVEFINSEIGDYSYIARNSIIHNTTIGKFCSIGPNVVVGYGDHPIHLLSTSPIFYSEKTGFDIGPNKDLFCGHSKVEIGNDVWIGANVFVKNGIKIGNGAVIGAGSVIINDVVPYSVTVGVPGKIKSKRFSEDIIFKLEELKWWEWPNEVIKDNHNILSSEKIIENIDLLFEIKKANKIE
ncbi:CatB-related O-acetyltransferase [Flavobacterium lacustre]|uniref:CatB-related O-acetyltransferase n=1 Tax=Flavobacterium lacustre TaxID=3016339 RepID=UPI0022B6C594|nr:CatB-related O-acetyltransferase [Flavobacterium lacustre]